MRTDDLRPMNDEPDLPETDEKSDIWEDDPDAPPTPQERGWEEEVDPDAEDRPAPKDDLTPDQYATDLKDLQVTPVVSDLETNLAIEDFEDNDGVGPLEAKVRIPLHGTMSA